MYYNKQNIANIFAQTIKDLLMKKLLTKTLSTVLALALLLSPLYITKSARADTFYKTFVSLCEGQEWLVSFVEGKFIENGKRFDDSVLEDDPILLNITELILPSHGIKGIPEAVKYFKNLAYVDVSYNEIEDISVFNLCPYIIYLRADGNLLESVDVSPLTQLKVLLLGDNDIAVMPNLSNNKALTTLDLSHNKIAVLSSLEGLTSLVWVDISANDITSTAGMGKLTMSDVGGDSVLDLSYNHIRNIEALKDAAGVCTLDLSHNFLASGFGDIPSCVVSLDLSHNNVATASSLSGKTNIKYLDLSYNLLTTVEDFNTCSNLVLLDLEKNNIKDTKGLDGFKKLETLDLSSNGISDMPLCTALTELKHLDLSHNSIASFALVNRYAKLVTLDASYNKAQEFSGINTLSSLVYADFSYNEITKAYPRLYLTTPSLRVLKLSGNSFSAAELKNVLANGYRSLWLCDMDLKDKIPAMTSYSKTKEIYVSGSTLSQADIDNIFTRTDYTGIGLGSIIDDVIVPKLGELKDLITLNLDGTVYVHEYFEELAQLNVVELSLVGCEIDAVTEALFSGNIQKYDLSDNLITTVETSVLTNALMRGAVVDFSGNRILENSAMYYYIESIGYEFDDNFLDINEDRYLAFNSQMIRCNVGDVVDIYSYLAMNGIYSELDIPMPRVEDLEISLINGKASKLEINTDTLNVKILKKISVLENMQIEVKVKGNSREEYTARVILYTEVSPVTEAVVDDVRVIYGIDLNTTYEGLINSFGFDDSFTVKMTYSDGTDVDPQDIVGTGSIITVTDNETGEELYRRTVVIFGDVNGNGKINTNDFMMIKRHIYRETYLEGIYYFAGDINGNGAINTNDFMMIKRHIYKQSFISQQR